MYGFVGVALGAFSKSVASLLEDKLKCFFFVFLLFLIQFKRFNYEGIIIQGGRANRGEIYRRKSKWVKKKESWVVKAKFASGNTIKKSHVLKVIVQREITRRKRRKIFTV